MEITHVKSDKKRQKYSWNVVYVIESGFVFQHIEIYTTQYRQV